MGSVVFDQALISTDSKLLTQTSILGDGNTLSCIVMEYMTMGSLADLFSKGRTTAICKNRYLLMI